MASTSISVNEKPVDRISNLPTKLTSHILSFLPTKDAVGTSVLSTHWNQQWETITSLDFDDDLWIKGSSTTTTPASFMDFVYRVLLLNVSRLDLFTLRCGQDYGVKHVSDWLFAALSRHAQHIELMVKMNDGTHLQLDRLFSSTTLAVLKLGVSFHLRVPKQISLVSLKILHLTSVGFKDSESLSRLVSSSPVLEELEVVGRLNKSVRVINISSLQLKRLLLCELYYPTGDLSFEVVINTPSLEYLDLGDVCIPELFHIETLHCLDRASIYTHHYSLKKHYLEGRYNLSPRVGLLVAISNVRSLYISEFSFKILCYSRCKAKIFELPDFPRLTDLEIGGIDSNDELSLLVTFLQRSPRLASLKFAVGRLYMGWDQRQPADVPSCMRYNLKVIEVNSFLGIEEHVSMLRYFLEKTNCLKELILPMIKEIKGKIIKKVLMLPRASKCCKIVLT